MRCLKFDSIYDAFENVQLYSS